MWKAPPPRGIIVWKPYGPVLPEPVACEKGPTSFQQIKSDHRLGGMKRLARLERLSRDGLLNSSEERMICIGLLIFPDGPNDDIRRRM